MKFTNPIHLKRKFSHLHTTLFYWEFERVIFYHKILIILPNPIKLLVVCSLNINKKKIQTAKFNNFIGHNSFLFSQLNISLY
jgi:hypothetical protein